MSFLRVKMEGEGGPMNESVNRMRRAKQEEAMPAVNPQAIL